MQVGTDHNTPSSPTRKRRLRARKACEPCRERKRKCDGNHPCGSCVRCEYVCHYVSVRRKEDVAGSISAISPRSSIRNGIPESSPVLPATSISQASEAARATSENSEDSFRVANRQQQFPEANSGAAFVRKLALALDPNSAPRSRLFAWNLFLGARRLPDYYPRVQPIIQILSQPAMENLATVYLEKVDPCYGFIAHDVLRQRIQSRWMSNSLEEPYDAVLCGVAALAMLFSRINVEFTEIDLVENAKYILERSTDAQPGIDIVTGWVLRVAYLRMTASPHTAWMASCAMMHTIEASNIHIPARLSEEGVTPDLWRRICGIARHLNIWPSFDLGRSRVILPHAPPSVSSMPSTRSGDYTVELLNLLPCSETLDREEDLDLPRLQTALRDVLKQQHSQPPSVLAQTNVVLLLVRRLRGLNFNLSGTLLEEVLSQTARALRSAQAMLDTGNPWHHVANVPFQIVCILLAIDNTSAITQLGDAIRTLNNVTQKYNTDAAREALNTACLLVRLYQKRKDADAKSLAQILHTYSPASIVEPQMANASYDIAAEIVSMNNPSWLEDLMTDVPDFQGYDVGQILDYNAQVPAPVF